MLNRYLNFLELRFYQVKKNADTKDGFLILFPSTHWIDRDVALNINLFLCFAPIDY